MIGLAVLSASWEAGLQHQFRAAAKWAFNIIESSGQLWGWLSTPLSCEAVGQDKRRIMGSRRWRRLDAGLQHHCTTQVVVQGCRPRQKGSVHAGGGKGKRGWMVHWANVMEFVLVQLGRRNQWTSFLYSKKVFINFFGNGLKSILPKSFSKQSFV